MCNFKSGIIFKNRVVLAPEGNESHSDLLDSLNIEDTRENASRVFVRAELSPINNNEASDVKIWRYKVDQDIVPDWYEKEPGRYEEKFREAVRDYMSERYCIEFGYFWNKIIDGDKEIYMMAEIMGYMKFGDTNDYADSYVRKFLKESDLAKEVKEKYGNRVLPIEVNLTSMDGFKDYGKVTDDVLSIPTIPFLMKYGEQISTVDNWWWTSTPNQTPTRKDSRCVRGVNGDGCVFYDGCVCDGGVRPFFILKS